ncbi:MAG: Na+/H+ antiporter subunit E [Desulfovermiculus sp.]
MAEFIESDKERSTTALRWFRSCIIRVCVFALLWWGLTGSSRDWPLAMVFVLGAAISSLILYCPIPFRPTGLVRFIPFFLVSSLQGGLDVARRAFSPAMPLQPGLIIYNLRIVHPVAKVVFIWVVSLLPGTASVHLDGQRLHIHVLDVRLDHALKFEKLEHYVSELLQRP